ncbi:hypothetical protein COT07_01545 [Candidatus Woesearchaeota archaeon CG07_land_8_20_14_0_80_44_23]|nr:MAG: hypothetical protein COT07_01545 [Candidatus Woesearchaeota archaeon CG07_land_8_20_14_0_80_44_23]QBM01452.1 alanine--tRNA ligase [uncultured archaeon]
MKKEFFETYDSGITELPARVKKIAKEGSLTIITLDKTPFRPASGGQPTDFGTIENDSFSAKVVDTSEKEGEIIHKCKIVRGAVSVGNEVVARIDFKRRKSLMLMHSGEHLFFSCLKKVLGEKGIPAEVEKVAIGEQESALFVKASSLNWYLIFEAEELANKIISEARAVSVSYVRKEGIEELSKNGLRIKADRIKDGFIRVVEISGADLSACTGTHVKSTSQIGFFIATGLKAIGSGHFEIKFKAGEAARQELFSQARILRKEQALLGTNGEEAFQLMLKILDDKKRLEEKQQQALFERIANLRPESISGILFYSHSFENEEQKVIVKAASKLCNEKSVVALINRKEPGKATLYVMRSKELGLDMLSLLKDEILRQFPGKGGGNSSYATGEVEMTPEQENSFFDAVRAFIRLNC